MVFPACFAHVGLIISLVPEQIAAHITWVFRVWVEGLLCSLTVGEKVDQSEPSRWLVS